MKISGKVLVCGILSFFLTAAAAWFCHWGDLHTYYTAGNSLLSGRVDLYAADFGDSRIMDYRYPPFFLFVFVPLSLLPYVVVKFIWLWLNIAAVYLTVRFIARAWKTVAPNGSRLNLILIISCLATAKYFLMQFQLLNLHLIVVCLTVGSFYFALKTRPFSASILLALAICFKIVPVLMLPYFAVKRQWKLLTATVSLILVFNFIPALYFGTAQNLRILQDWYHHVVIANEFHDTNGPVNVSLKGQLERGLTDIDYSKRVEDKEYEQVNIFSMEKRAVKEIWKFSAALIFAAGILLFWYCAILRKSEKFDGQKPARGEFDALAFWEIGLMICLMSLVAPRTNIYFLVVLFFPIIPLVASLFQEKFIFNRIIFLIFITITIILPLVPGRFTARYFLVIGVDFYALLILCLAMAYNLYRKSLRMKNDSDNLR